MLQVEHLSYDILEEGRQSEILSDVSFTVQDGEMLVITGPNGGGKSTLAKLLMGIYKETAGKISSQYKDGRTLSEEDFSRKVSAGAHIDELAQLEGDLAAVNSETTAL